jgi:hypothetical protein
VALVAGLVVFGLRDGGSDRPAAAPSSATASPGGPVPVTPPPAAPAATTALCARLLGALPTTLARHPARAVSAAPDRVVAWGEPPVVLRCGVPPVTVPPDTNKQFEINGVRWFAEARGSVVVFTTTDRTAPVEVTVPAHTADNPADVVAELSRPIGRVVPPAR